MPRHQHDPWGGGPAPDIATILARGTTSLTARCPACERRQRVECAALPQHLTMMEVRPLLRCSGCGHRGCALEADLPGQPSDDGPMYGDHSFSPHR